MKKWLFIACLPILFISCFKDDVSQCGFTESTLVAPETERATIRNFLTANSVVATEHTSGFFYRIDSLGTGNSASICSNILIDYTGSFMQNNAQFDAGTGTSFILGQLIPAWQKAIPLIKSGGLITIYVPPTLGYGYTDIVQNGYVIIPSGSYLTFVVRLKSVQ